MQRPILGMPAPLFFSLMSQHALHRQGIYDPEQEAYVGTSVLDRFTRTERMQNPFAGLREEESAWYVGDMLGRARHAGEYEATAIYRHVGDRTLFILGLFPESLDRFGLHPLYESAGSSSYRAVSHLYPSGKSISDLFLTLGINFPRLVAALRNVREQVNIGKLEDWRYVLFPKERDLLKDWMLDAMTRWKKSKKEEDKSLALQLAAELGYDAEHVFL